MNENTQQLLEKLAEKLGTTTEYLWQILLNQAKYDVIISFIQMTFMAVFIIATVKIHFKLAKEIPKDPNDKWSRYESLYDKYEEAAIIPMFFAGIIVIIMVICFLAGFNDLMSAIFNPEYWALNKILNHIN
jgi:hypothetical protein